MHPLLRRNGHLWTPLDLAADKGYSEIISLLIEADAPLETKDKSAVSAAVGCDAHMHTRTHAHTHTHARTHTHTQ